jgi:surfeit locus 1 family protein
MHRYVMPVLFGLFGVGILIGLGSWQVQRLDEKRAYLAGIDARIFEAPKPLPARPSPETDQFMPVTAQGRFTGEAVDVLVSRKEIGAGYRVVAVLETAERRVLVDRGFVALEAKGAGHAPGPAAITGNLHWPVEVDSYTPAPDATRGIWFARDVAALAQALNTEPALIVARVPTGDGIDPMPVDTSGIPNDHLSYAITWFSLAVVWLGMTVLLLWRIRRRTA